jgi:hypothetical protein
MSAIISESAIISDWVRAETKTPTPRVANRSREEQFHCALERYIVDYRKHRALADDAACGRDSAWNFWFLPRLANPRRR